MKGKNKEKVKVVLSFFWPHVFSLILVVISSCFFKFHSLTFERFDIFISSLISTLITSIGFLLTIVAIILGLIQTRIVKFISSKDKYNLLAKSFFTPIFEGIVLVIICFCISTTVNIDNSFVLKGWLLYFCQFFSSAFIIDIFKVGWVLLSIFKEVTKEAGKNYNQDEGEIDLADPNDFFTE